MIYIRRATIFTPHRQIDDGALLVEGSRIVGMGPADQLACPPTAEVIDAEGLLLVPGFIDLQLNGAFGDDFTAGPDTIWPVAARLPRYGVTSFLPTIITAPLETVARAQAILAQERPDHFRGAEPLGLHLEGPFLNLKKKGAHNPAYLRRPTLDAITDWSPEQGVRLVTLAPELPDATEIIETLAARGVVVSAGHSTATYSQAKQGIKAGLTYGTHLFNAMPLLGHREPGLAGALLTDPKLTVGLISDGIHLHPAMVSLVWQMKGSDRLNLVSDAMAALGMPPGRYKLGDHAVTVTQTDARLEDGTLAGSILPLDAALRNLMAFTGCSLAQALPTVTTTPATLLGLPDRGRIAPGMVADLVLLSPELKVVATMAAGKLLNYE